MLSFTSAGVGRTGTFIGLDYLYDEGKATQYIDVYRSVETLRHQRVNMVQKKVRALRSFVFFLLNKISWNVTFDQNNHSHVCLVLYMTRSYLVFPWFDTFTLVYILKFLHFVLMHLNLSFRSDKSANSSNKLYNNVKM